MRTIKFRGKRIDNGEWVYGYFVIIPTAECRIYWQPFSEATNNTYHIVDPSTVGQFTGLHDKDRKESYFKDIVKATLRDIDGNYRGEYIGTIEWGESELELHTTDHHFPVASWRCVESFEVIGNIHENPELLND